MNLCFLVVLHFSYAQQNSGLSSVFTEELLDPGVYQSQNNGFEPCTGFNTVSDVDNFDAICLLQERPQNCSQEMYDRLKNMGIEECQNKELFFENLTNGKRVINKNQDYSTDDKKMNNISSKKTEVVEQERQQDTSNPAPTVLNQVTNPLGNFDIFSLFPDLGRGGQQVVSVPQQGPQVSQPLIQPQFNGWSAPRIVSIGGPPQVSVNFPSGETCAFNSKCSAGLICTNSNGGTCFPNSSPCSCATIEQIDVSKWRTEKQSCDQFTLCQPPEQFECTPIENYGTFCTRPTAPAPPGPQPCMVVDCRGPGFVLVGAVGGCGGRCEQKAPGSIAPGQPCFERQTGSLGQCGTGYDCQPFSQQEFGLIRNPAFWSCQKRECVDDWRDKAGTSCSDYQNRELCTRTGELGRGFKPEWINFEEWRNNGKTALNCRQCGCKSEGVPVSTCACEDHRTGEICIQGKTYYGACAARCAGLNPDDGYQGRCEGCGIQIDCSRVCIGMIHKSPCQCVPKECKNKTCPCGEKVVRVGRTNTCTCQKERGIIDVTTMTSCESCVKAQGAWQVGNCFSSCQIADVACVRAVNSCGNDLVEEGGICSSGSVAPQFRFTKNCQPGFTCQPQSPFPGAPPMVGTPSICKRNGFDCPPDLSEFKLSRENVEWCCKNKQGFCAGLKEGDVCTGTAFGGNKKCVEGFKCEKISLFKSVCTRANYISVVLGGECWDSLKGGKLGECPEGSECKKESMGWGAASTIMVGKCTAKLSPICEKCGNFCRTSSNTRGMCMNDSSCSKRIPSPEENHCSVGCGGKKCGEGCLMGDIMGFCAQKGKDLQCQLSPANNCDPYAGMTCNECIKDERNGWQDNKCNKGCPSKESVCIKPGDLCPLRRPELAAGCIDCVDSNFVWQAGRCKKECDQTNTPCYFTTTSPYRKSNFCESWEQGMVCGVTLRTGHGLNKPEKVWEGKEVPTPAACLENCNDFPGNTDGGCCEYRILTPTPICTFKSSKFMRLARDGNILASIVRRLSPTIYVDCTTCLSNGFYWDLDSGFCQRLCSKMPPIPECAKTYLQCPNTQVCLTDTKGMGPMKNKACVPEFTFRGEIHAACTLQHTPDNRPWCSTKVDQSGNHITGHWGDCSSSCTLPEPQNCAQFFAFGDFLGKNTDCPFDAREVKLGEHTECVGLCNLARCCRVPETCEKCLGAGGHWKDDRLCTRCTGNDKNCRIRSCNPFVKEGGRCGRNLQCITGLMCLIRTKSPFPICVQEPKDCSSCLNAGGHWKNNNQCVQRCTSEDNCNFHQCAAVGVGVTCSDLIPCLKGYICKRTRPGRPILTCVSDPRTSAPCCRAFTAECYSCINQTSKEAVCEKFNYKLAGCEKKTRCCRALNAKCLACQKRLSISQFCRRHTNVPGCGRPPTPGPIGMRCADSRWTDQAGTTCAAYLERSLCTRTGGFGTKWQTKWVNFEKWGKNGMTAKNCPQCGCRAITLACMSVDCGPNSIVVGAVNGCGGRCESVDKGCCKAFTAKCLSCQQQISIQTFCNRNPTTTGCKVDCCKANTAECFACQNNQTVQEFCKQNPNFIGCQKANGEALVDLLQQDFINLLLAEEQELNGDHMVGHILRFIFHWAASLNVKDEFCPAGALMGATLDFLPERCFPQNDNGVHKAMDKINDICEMDEFKTKISLADCWVFAAKVTTEFAFGKRTVEDPRGDFNGRLVDVRFGRPNIVNPLLSDNGLCGSDASGRRRGCKIRGYNQFKCEKRVECIWLPPPTGPKQFKSCKSIDDVSQVASQFNMDAGIAPDRMFGGPIQKSRGIIHNLSASAQRVIQNKLKSDSNSWWENAAEGTVNLFLLQTHSIQNTTTLEINTQDAYSQEKVILQMKDDHNASDQENGTLPKKDDQLNTDSNINQDNLILEMKEDGVRKNTIFSNNLNNDDVFDINNEDVFYMDPNNQIMNNDDFYEMNNDPDNQIMNNDDFYEMNNDPANQIINVPEIIDNDYYNINNFSNDQINNNVYDMDIDPESNNQLIDMDDITTGDMLENMLMYDNINKNIENDINTIKHHNDNNVIKKIKDNKVKDNNKEINQLSQHSDNKKIEENSTELLSNNNTIWDMEIDDMDEDMSLEIPPGHPKLTFLQMEALEEMEQSMGSPVVTLFNNPTDLLQTDDIGNYPETVPFQEICSKNDDYDFTRLPRFNEQFSNNMVKKFVLQYGFTKKGTVAIMGGHSTGHIHGNLGPSIERLPWTSKPTVLDNEYFIRLLQFPLDITGASAPIGPPPTNGGLVMLATDLLLRDEPDFAKHVRAFAQNNQVFQEEFARAMTLLLENQHRMQPKFNLFNPRLLRTFRPLILN